MLKLLKTKSYEKFKISINNSCFATLVGCVNGDDYGTPDLSNDCVTIATTKEVSDITSISTATTVQYTTTDAIDYIEALCYIK